MSLERGKERVIAWADEETRFRWKEKYFQLFSAVMKHFGLDVLKDLR